MTVLAFYPQSSLLNNLFILVVILLAIVMCVYEAFAGVAETKALWLLLASGFLLSTIGQAELTYASTVGGIHTQTIAFNFDFFYYVYSIPLLLAICARSKDAGQAEFVWLDGAQALIASLLGYLVMFSELPSYAGAKPISAAGLMYLNDVENWILVAAIILRFFANPTPARRRFYRILAPYLVSNAFVVLVVGYLELKQGWRDGWQDVLWDLPYVALFGWLANSPMAKGVGQEEAADQEQPAGSLELLIDNLSPVLFTLAIALLSVQIAPRHPSLAFSCISAAVAIYGARAAILQVRYVRSQQELTRAMVASEQASLAKSQFLANISHEIRTPMNGILGMTELALTTNLNAEQRDFLTIVKSSADHLLTIINEILDFSKMEAGKTVLQSDTFDLPTVASDAVRGLAVLAHKKGLELTLRIAPDVPADLCGDKVRLAQILINLIGNAIKFTEHGEINVEVTLKNITYSRAELMFSVRDSGIGILQEKQGGLFQAFQQAHSSGSRLYGGTGLGLAVCRSLVSLMGGAIELRSEPGVGTTVFFTAQFDLLPGWQPAVDVPEGDACSGLPLLIVDDNATTRNILSELAARWKMKPQTCESGEAGLAELARAAASGEPYRIVLLDEQMPIMDGFTMLEQIRRDGVPATVVMLLDSRDRVASVARCRQMNISAYVIKPVFAEEVLAAIRLALGLVQAEAPAAAAEHAIPSSPRSLRILLADDNLVNQKVATTMLGKMGHRITVAGNGLEVLERWRKDDFDLILMDVQMPEMNGLQATMQIRREEDGHGRRLPIVAMTASAMNEDRERCLAAGMDNFISKPVSSRAIEQVITETFPQLSEAETAP